MTSTQTPKPQTCRKCGGTGRVNSVVDGGRCWSCTGQADTSYTRKGAEELPTWDEICAARKAARDARRAAR